MVVDGHGERQVLPHKTAPANGVSVARQIQLQECADGRVNVERSRILRDKDGVADQQDLGTEATVERDEIDEDADEVKPVMKMRLASKGAEREAALV